ncbi:MAG: DNA primase [bacterium]|nr:DNA primase [bacterium]
MQIPQQIIDQIRDRADIVEVVSRVLEVKRMGNNYKGLCPFHEEKTPSFNVNPDRQIFHCFGCGRGGNVFTFLMEMEGVSFPEAVRDLGKRYGVDVPSRQVPKEELGRNDELYRVSDFAARWYHRNLVEHASSEPVRRYLEKRGIPREAWTSWRLGCAPEGWDTFFQACRNKSVPQDVLRELKLVVYHDKSSRYFDYFRNRVMFPIASPSGRVVAFGARALGDAEPKYLNSIESAIYQKRRMLFGMPQSRDAIRSQRQVILVEGYTDCISMHLNGFQQTVASCGTATTPEHASQLRRLSQRVVLMPDGDEAGQESALSAGSVMLAAGLDVRVVVLDEGVDPDTLAQESGPEEIEKIVGGAMEYLQYLDYIMTVRQMSPREKETVIQRVAAGLRGSGDALRHEVIVQDVARILNVSPESLKGRESRIPGDRPKGAARVVDRASARRVELEKSLLRLLLEDTPEAAGARETLDSDDFLDPDSRRLYKLLDSALENHIDIRSAAFQKRAETVGLEGFAAEITLISIPPGHLDILLKDTVRRVKELKIRDELLVLREKLRDLPEESEEAVAVAEHYAQLKRALSEL